jgi:sulfatase modifying factor 1
MKRPRARYVAVLSACAALGACGLFPDVGALEGDGGNGDAAGPDATLDGDALDADATVLDAGPGDAPSDASCPSGQGPTMVQFGKLCIDSTEVTNLQYTAFLVAVPDASTFQQPPECAWNTTFLPANGLPSSSKPSNPVANVNWCQAWAYCVWAGKELCGGPDGGGIAWSAFSDPGQSVWMNACTNGGKNLYPYGNTFIDGACNQDPPDAAYLLAPVGTFPGCDGGLPGLYDMIGNVEEWENACDNAGQLAGDASADNCHFRGGGAGERGPGVTCAWPEDQQRNHTSNVSGVRCCAHLP